MCGIAGIFGINGKPVVTEEIRAMCNAMIDRGPDEEGIYVSNNIGLGMRRLSIIDLNQGYIPIHNEDKSLRVVLNGEIYNYREIRADLLSKGHIFYTDTDTEVIVHLYEEYGDDCVSKLRGMFAFALWDDRKERLLIARDRLGIKPLYFGEFNQRLFFASELKSILQISEIDRNLHWGSVGHLFATLTTLPEDSIIDGVKKLQPGHILVVEKNRAPRISCYWNVEFIPDYSKSQAYFEEGIRQHLEESVRLRMISDVPLGAFLSGGIDSSAVVATMARLSNDPIKTFSIGFTEANYNEAPYAKQVADALGTEHHELILEPDVMSIMEDLPWDLDEPFGDSSAIPTFMVSKLAAEHVTVALSGDGGDEIFAGYDKYVKEQADLRYQKIPAFIREVLGAVGGTMKEGMKGRNYLRHFGLNGSERYLNSISGYMDIGQRKSLFQGHAAEQILANDSWKSMIACLEKGHGDWLTALQYLDIKNYLPLDILTKVDRMSMANSLEARVPLLDHKLVEFSATIPPEMKLNNGRTKHIFKEALKGVLPDSILNRKKQGFSMPLGDWFRGELNSFVRDLLLSEKSRARGIFNPAYVERMLKLHEQGRPVDQMLWTHISFELWCQEFLDKSSAKLQKEKLEAKAQKARQLNLNVAAVRS